MVTGVYVGWTAIPGC